MRLSAEKQLGVYPSQENARIYQSFENEAPQTAKEKAERRKAGDRSSSFGKLSLSSSTSVVRGRPWK